MRELRIAVIGNVDAGKSSLTGVLTKNILDDGRGYARSLVTQYRHEKTTGKTSSVTQNYVKNDNNRVVIYIDLAGHEKYLKTTLHGLTGYYPDYGMVVIGANMGLTDITKEHMNIAIALNIPFMVVITKIDIAPAHVLEKTVLHLEEILKSKIKHKSIIHMNEGNIDSLTMMRKYIPIFQVSNKEGTNIDLLKKHIENVHKFYIEHSQLNIFHVHDDLKESNIFSIDRSYQVNGVGTVLAGKVCNGVFKKNDTVYLGPFHGVWYPVTLKSFHDNFQQSLDKLENGQSGCIAIKNISSNAKNLDLKKLIYRKNVYLINSEECKKYTSFEFVADVIVMHTHSVTISKDYQPIINCNKIVQCAKILEIEDKTHIRAGDKCRMRFRFMYRPEFIQENDKFIFREGQTRGIGIIKAVEYNKTK